MAGGEEERGDDGCASERRAEDTHPPWPVLFETDREVAPIEELLGERDGGISGDPAGELQRIGSDAEPQRMRGSDVRSDQ